MNFTEFLDRLGCVAGGIVIALAALIEVATVVIFALFVVNHLNELEWWHFAIWIGAHVLVAVVMFALLGIGALILWVLRGLVE